jgi:hypothetical protein
MKTLTKIVTLCGLSRLSIVYPAFILSAVATTNSFGVPITFTYTGTGFGMFGGGIFGDSAFTITALGDTATREPFPGRSGYKIVHSSASITIAGMGTFDFVTGTETFFDDVHHTPGFRHSSLSGPDLVIFTTLQLLPGWDMLTSVGPSGGGMALIQWNALPVITSGGRLLFENAHTPGSFSAVVGSASTVPDNPSTALLFGCALVGVIGLRRTCFKAFNKSQVQD